MATIVYLDAEDEITSAASRIREARDTRVGIVLPFGSRVATSRINFRLLAREAQANGRRLDIVAPDASARALAASAGLPVFASVGEYEAALARGDTGGEPGGDPGDDAAAAIAAATAAGAIAAGAAVAAGDPPPAGDPTPAATSITTGSRGPITEPLSGDHGAPGIVGTERPEPRAVTGRRNGPGRGVLALVLAALLIVGVGGVAAFLLLPSATITVTPVIEPVGPVSFTVIADPDATAVDAAAGVIPATTLEIPVTVQSEFPATGKRVEQEPAKGGVRWTNCDPTASYTIPRGTVVRTSGGRGFETEESVFLPVAIINASLDLKCQTSEVAVTATQPGPGGNVDAGAIRVVPARYNRNVIRVTNPAATTGGTREEFPEVAAEDVEAALAQLQESLGAQFELELDNPDRIPAGTTVFPETAVLGTPVPAPVDPLTLVGEEAASFALQLSATGTVQAADASPVAAIAEARLQASVSDGYELVEGSTSVEVGEGTVEDGIIVFPVEVSAKQVRPVDAATLEAMVLGLSEEEATAVLEEYGEVVIVLWPDWVSTVPTLDQRVTLTVAEPLDPAVEATPSPSPTAPPSPSDPGPTDDSSSEPVPSG